ncbi:MAG: hypothetical protein ACT4P6_18800 [Gemmatimonadaceae bacterium]
MRTFALLVLLGLGSGQGAAQRAPGCVPLSADLAAQIANGWSQYRASRWDSADAAFRHVLSRCPNAIGAANGAAYVALQRDSLTSSRQMFQRILLRAPRDYDALVGLGVAAYRAADLAASRAAFTRALGAFPDDSTSRAYLERIALATGDTGEAAQAPVRRPRPVKTVVGARVRNRSFEVPDGRGGWTPIWIAGVNLGAALPGKHPSDFPPNDSTYERWIELFARMNSNVIRLYTIHPPHFYQAVRRWNLAHPQQPIWLIHGVWTELPPGKHEERYDDSTWNAAFLAETRRVVDLLHGSASLPPRAGHASGFYDADVSPWVLAYIIGREWEPYSVVEYVKRRPKLARLRGRYVRVTGGHALDVWLGEALNYLVDYEMRTYNAQRPVAYTNWPTLDPLRHITESTKDEEIALFRARGEKRDTTVREYDNDAIALDARVMRATAAFPAGIFASYHAYPYYPDFMVLDPAYNRASTPEGPSAYYGYLKELVEHHRDMPVVISEYGVPSSRGMAHWQPQGWHHGGHDERAQADIDARLTRDIHASGAAGAVLFAAIDEWFKKNWIVIDFEHPLERNRLWLNPLDAEQNYGIVALRAGLRDSAIVIDGRSDDWHGTQPLYRGDTARTPDPLSLRGLTLRSDEAYLYLRLDVGTIDWTRANYLIGIDTYRSDLGDTRFPYTGDTSAVGFEFMLDLRGPRDSRLLVDSPYNLYRVVNSWRVYNRPFRTLPNSDGRYDSVRVTSNRRRIGRDGTVYDAYTYDRGLLVHARQSETTLADWYADTLSGTIEIRLAWGLLHVMDPSSHTVLYGDAATGEVAGVATDGFRFVVHSFDPRAPRGPGDRLPNAAATIPTWSWRAWEQPRWYAEIKPAFEAMQRTFADLLRTPATDRATDYRSGTRPPKVRDPKR